jgi:hypothetical protein
MGEKLLTRTWCSRLGDEVWPVSSRTMERSRLGGLVEVGAQRDVLSPELVWGWQWQSVMRSVWYGSRKKNGHSGTDMGWR